MAPNRVSNTLIDEVTDIVDDNDIISPLSQSIVKPIRREAVKEKPKEPETTELKAPATVIDPLEGTGTVVIDSPKQDLSLKKASSDIAKSKAAEQPSKIGSPRQQFPPADASKSPAKPQPQNQKPLFTDKKQPSAQVSSPKASHSPSAGLRNQQRLIAGRKSPEAKASSADLNSQIGAEMEIVSKSLKRLQNVIQ